ncbi:hypothetical protein MMC22_000907 [Lobaria immixta]|nr:hypothetical protein [Lobaria immixta]
METVGAVVSIVQVAQIGAQLSLKLYKIAEAVGSANKDVQYVAKDIALFSSVLKDLGNTLSRGQESRLYREDAYQTSRQIVKECESVFKEIQEILKKSSLDGTNADVITVGRTEKFLWIFRRSRVQLLRANLESLKSTILLQLAVLSYGEKVSSSSNPVSSAEDLLTLESLVLANETTKSAFQDLQATGNMTAGPTAEDPVDSLAKTSSTISAPKLKSGHIPSQIRTGPVGNPQKLQPTSLPFHAKGDQPSRCERPILNTSPEFMLDQRRYADIWDTVDRLELALRNIDTAKWECERLQKNMVISKHISHTYQNRAEEEKGNRLKFTRSLSEFGLSKEKVSQALVSVVLYTADAATRTQTECMVPRDDKLFATLKELGAPLRHDKERPNFWIINRWMPSNLEDILWEHTSQIIAETMEREHRSLLSSPQDMPCFSMPERIPEGRRQLSLPSTIPRSESIGPGRSPDPSSQSNKEKWHEKALRPLLRSTYSQVTSSSPTYFLPPLQTPPTGIEKGMFGRSSEEAQQQRPLRSTFSFSSKIPIEVKGTSHGIIPTIPEPEYPRYYHTLGTLRNKNSIAQMQSEDRVEREVRDLLRRWTFVDPGLLFASTNVELRSALLNTGERPGGEESNTKRATEKERPLMK